GVGGDVEFDKDSLPAMYDALEVKTGKDVLTFEVAQHLDERSVRAIAMSTTDGLKRGQEVIATGAPISVPVGEQTQGRMFDVVGNVIDGGKQPSGKKASIHREPPALDEQSNK